MRYGQFDEVETMGKENRDECRVAFPPGTPPVVGFPTELTIPAPIVSETPIDPAISGTSKSFWYSDSGFQKTVSKTKSHLPPCCKDVTG